MLHMYQKGIPVVKELLCYERGATSIHTRCTIKGIKLGKGKRFLKVSKNQAYSETPGLHLHKGFRKVLARFLCLISHVRPISKIKSGLYILPPVSPPHPAILTWNPPGLLQSTFVFLPPTLAPLLSNLHSGCSVLAKPQSYTLSLLGSEFSGFIGQKRESP